MEQLALSYFEDVTDITELISYLRDLVLNHNGNRRHWKNYMLARFYKGEFGDVDDTEQNVLTSLDNFTQEDITLTLRDMMGPRYPKQGPSTLDRYDALVPGQDSYISSYKHIFLPADCDAVIELERATDQYIGGLLGMFYAYLRNGDYVYRILQNGIYLYKTTAGQNLVLPRITVAGSVLSTKHMLDMIRRYSCYDEIIYSFDYKPSTVGDHRSVTLNEFAGFRVRFEPERFTNASNCLAPLLDHLFIVWCNRDKVLYDYVMGWIATLFQKRTKIGSAILVQGLTGTGKSMIPMFLGSIIGDQAFATPSVDNLKNKFNEIIERSLLISVDEIFDRTFSFEDILKKLITDRTFVVERKYREARTAVNCCNLIASTNHINSIRMSLDERRFLVLEAVRQSDDPTHLEALGKSLETETMRCEFYHYMMRWDISAFSAATIPQTEIKTSMQVASADPFIAYIATKLCEARNAQYANYIISEDLDMSDFADKVNRGDIPVVVELRSSDMCDEYKQHCTGVVNVRTIATLARQYGLEATRPNIDGKRPRCYRTTWVEFQNVITAIHRRKIDITVFAQI